MTKSPGTGGMMSDEPDYRRCSLADLYDIERRLDADRYPDRAAALQAEIAYRHAHPGQREAEVGSAPDEAAGRKRGSKGPYAGFWIRLLAALADGLFLLSLFMLVAYCVDFRLLGIDPIRGGEPGLAHATAILVYLVNMVYLVSRTGQSLGQKMAGIAVVNHEGRPASFPRILGRQAFATFISAVLLLGFLPILWTSRKQALHDWVFGTRVVREAALGDPAGGIARE